MDIFIAFICGVAVAIKAGHWIKTWTVDTTTLNDGDGGYLEPTARERSQDFCGCGRGMSDWWEPCPECGRCEQCCSGPSDCDPLEPPSV